MILDSISTIAEITPYYGNLDDVYRLLKRLNIKTSKVWEATWITLSKRISRKKIELGCDSKISFVDIPLEFPLILTLFQPKIINITNEEEYEWVIELFEKFEYPKMINMYLSLNLDKDRDNLADLSNYREYMIEWNFSLLSLYRNVVKIAIKRGIDLKWIKIFVFINEVPIIKDVEYCSYIVFPWNEESSVGSMIKVWNNFKESDWKFKEIYLIWDEMESKKFIKLYITLIKQNINIHVVFKKNIQKLTKLINDVALYQNIKTSFKLGDNDEYILWSLLRNTNTLKLRKWYYRSNLISKYAFIFTKGTIKFWSENAVNKASKVEIKQEELSSFEFYLIPIKASNQYCTKIDKILSLKDNKWEFAMNRIKMWTFKRDENDGSIYFLQCKFPTTKKLEMKLHYSNKESRILLKTLNTLWVN